jgi:uncharacterized protein (TIGR02996 family)
VLGNPGDDTARLVLADLLRESDDPHDRALGRFVWAGVTAAGFRDDRLLEDPLYYAAQREISAVASAGFLTGWVCSLGLGPYPPADRDWGWDSTFDRVTVRVGGATGVFTRGMLAELSLPLGDWYAVAPAALASWPLERASVTDVPGLTFSVDATDGEWRLSARLRVPGRRIPLVGGHVLPAAVASFATLTDGPGDWRVEEARPDRAALVAGITSVSASLVADLRDVAGDRWPPPGK